MTETFDEENKTCKVSLNSSYVYSFVRPQGEIERKEPITLDVRNVNAQLILKDGSAGTSIDNITTLSSTYPVSYKCTECECDTTRSVTFKEALDVIESGGTCQCCDEGEHSIDIDRVQRNDVGDFSTCSDEMYGTVECERCGQDVDISFKMEINS